MLKLEQIQKIVRRVKSDYSQTANQSTQAILAELEQTDEINLAGVDERLANTRFRVDNKPHIQVDNAVCKECSTQACVYVCPANLFTPLSDGTILFNYEQCFECGTCYVACNREGAITWTYPRGGFGVSFREA